ncbi:MAG: hypothetical protein WCW40_04225 [Bacteroidota bacterium]
MKLHTGTVILLCMIFISVVAGVLIVKTTYRKKHIENYTALETVHSLEYGDISMERYYRNGMNVKAFGYYKDGTLKSEYYVTDNAATSSKYITYYPDKKIETRSLKWMEGDSSHFLYEEYFPNGKIRRREGSKVSTWEYYDENGDPTVFYYRNGSRVTEVMFYSGGKKQDESDYNGGKRDGKWLQWDSTGNQIRSEMYTNGMKMN